MDHRCLDIFCVAPVRGGGTRLVRPWITAAIDMRTRKWLGWVIVETPSSDSIAAVLRQVFIRYGLPKECYWDNGKDFRCKWLEGGRDREEARPKVGDLEPAWRGVLDSLGVRVRHAIVCNARAKLIEPNFGRIADFDRTLPEWCGHKPGARPEHFQQLVDAHEDWAAGRGRGTPFRTIAEVAELYGMALHQLNERELKGEGMRKVTPTGRAAWWCPNEAWEILAPRVERRQADVTALQFCFAKRKQLTVRHGEIAMTFAGQPYHYRIKGNALQLGALSGQTVTIAYDPLDLGEVVVYDAGDRLVGMAECVQLRRMGEAAFTEDERNRRAYRKSVKALIDQVHKHVPMADAETRLRRRMAVMPERPEPVQVEVPVELPAGAAAAAELVKREAGFRFADVEASAAAAPAPAVEADEDDGTFSLFRGE